MVIGMSKTTQFRFNFQRFVEWLINYHNHLDDRGTRLGLGLFHGTVHCIVTLRCAHSFCLWSLLFREPIANNMWSLKSFTQCLVILDSLTSIIFTYLDSNIDHTNGYVFFMAFSMSPRTRKRGPFSCNHSPSLRTNGTQVYIWHVRDIQYIHIICIWYDMIWYDIWFDTYMFQIIHQYTSMIRRKKITRQYAHQKEDQDLDPK